MGRYRLAIILLFSLTSGCTFAPFTTTNSARTLGKDNKQIKLTAFPAVGTGFDYGVAENLDVGAHIELQLGYVFTASAKYAFINKGDGFAMALYGGLFQGTSIVDSKGYYVGPIFSYKRGGFEPYFLVKYNYVSWDAGTLNNEEAADEGDDLFNDINWNKEHFSYMSYKAGANFWFSNKFGINANFQVLSSLDTDVAKFSSRTIPGLEFMWRF